MILGIDTSCYTTSIAIVDSNKKLIYEEGQLLQVEHGERGLQQSKALFQHLGNFPSILKRAFEKVDRKSIKGIAVSSKPRPVEESYMPVFTAGISFAETLANTLLVPLFYTTHQEGHIEAGVWSANYFPNQKFLAVHISGGTSELLEVTPLENRSGYKIKKMGGTVDLHAGQFIDRVGVALGLTFPAGPKLELLARKSEGTLVIPTSVKGYDISFSGPETAAQRFIKAGSPAEEVARAVENNIASSLEKILKNTFAASPIREILIVGGVASNQYIRERLVKRLSHRAVGASLYFAEPKYSRDNSVGVALLGLKEISNRN